MSGRVQIMATIARAGGLSLWTYPGVVGLEVPLHRNSKEMYGKSVAVLRLVSINKIAFVSGHESWVTLSAVTPGLNI